MRVLSFVMTVAFGIFAVLSLFQRNYQVGILELLIAVHSLSDYFEYAAKEGK
jgi:hypothetical protein